MKEMPTSGRSLSCAAAAAWRTLLTQPTRGVSASAVYVNDQVTLATAARGAS